MPFMCDTKIWCKRGKVSIQCVWLKDLVIQREGKMAGVNASGPCGDYSLCHSIFLADESHLTGSPDTIVFCDHDGWIRLQDITIGQKVVTANGKIKVSVATKNDDEPSQLFAIELAGSQECYANGILTMAGWPAPVV